MVPAGLCLICLAAGGGGAMDDSVTVRTQVKPDRPWKEVQAMTLEGMRGFPRDPEDPVGNVDGSHAGQRADSTGFFHVTRSGNRWWMVDPEGYRTIHRGVVSVTPPRSGVGVSALPEIFGDRTQWAESTTALLRSNGFNVTGAWSETETMRSVASPLLNTRRSQLHEFIRPEARRDVPAARPYRVPERLHLRVRQRLRAVLR